MRRCNNVVFATSSDVSIANMQQRQSNVGQRPYVARCCNDVVVSTGKQIQITKFYYFQNHFIPKSFYNPQRFFSKQASNIIFQANYFIKISSFQLSLAPNLLSPWQLVPFYLIDVLVILFIDVLAMLLLQCYLIDVPFSRHLHHLHSHPLYCFPRMLYQLLAHVLSLQYRYCIRLKKHVRLQRG